MTTLFSVLSGLLIGAWASAIPLVLGEPGRLSDGEVCKAVWSSPTRPSAGCNAWANHRLNLFIWIGAVLLLVTVTVLVMAVRSVSNERRLKRTIHHT